MRDKKEKIQITDKKKTTGILLSILFTLVVPIGFVFIMGLLSQSFMMLYSFTKEIFIMFIILLVIGFGLIGFQIFTYCKVDSSTKGKRKLKKFKTRKKKIHIDTATN